MSSQAKPLNTPERNPVTHARHRREVFWQIGFPLILGVLLLIATVTVLIVMTVNEARLEQALGPGSESAMLGDFSSEEKALMRYNSGTTARLANVSQIWLLLPVLVMGLLAAAVLVALAYLATKLLGGLPGAMYLAQGFMARAALRVHTLTDKLVEPVLRGKSMAAAGRKVRQTARREVAALAAALFEKVSGE